MVLDAEDRKLPVFEPFHRLVVEIHVRDPQRRRAIDRFRRSAAAHREAVVLRRDLHRTILHAPHRMIPRAMAVQQLEGGSAEGASDQLVPEADAEYRYTAFGEPADGLQRVTNRLRVTGSIRDEEAIDVLPEDLGRGRRRRQRRDTAAALREQLERVSLHTEVVREHAILRLADGLDLVRLVGRYAARQIETFHAWMRLNALHHLARRLRGMRDCGAHRTRAAQMTCERTRVDTLERSDVRGTQILLH